MGVHDVLNGDPPQRAGADGHHPHERDQVGVRKAVPAVVLVHAEEGADAQRHDTDAQRLDEQRLPDLGQADVVTARPVAAALAYFAALCHFPSGPFTAHLRLARASGGRSPTLPLRLRCSARKYMMIAQRSSVLIWAA